MPEWIFRGGSEEFRIKTDSKRNLFVKSKITNFEWLPFKEALFKDREQRNKCHIMNMKVPRLTIDELHVYVITETLYGKFTQCYKYEGCFDDDGKFISGNVENKQKKIEDGLSTVSQ